MKNKTHNQIRKLLNLNQNHQKKIKYFSQVQKVMMMSHQIGQITDHQMIMDHQMMNLIIFQYNNQKTIIIIIIIIIKFKDHL